MPARGETAEARAAAKHGLWLLEKLTGIGAGLIAGAGLSLARPPCCWAT